MYPKVKMGDPGRDEAANYKGRDSCLKSNHLTRFSAHHENKNSQVFVAKTPKFYVPSIMTPPIGMSKETGKHRRVVDGEAKPNTKTSPILRPRAVLSSPDNDAIIGSINKKKENKGTKALKSPDHIPNRHSRCKDIHTRSHTDTKKTRDASPRVKIGRTASKESSTKLSSTERGNSRGAKTRVGKRVDP